jgi:hypothetical protein
MKTHSFRAAAILIACSATFAPAAALAQHPTMPPGMTHEEHLAQMKKDADLKARGKDAMGFDQDAATHHFRLTRDGGAIDVSAARPDDAATRDQIRVHLREIAKSFGEGVFEKPLATHGEMPPGVATMTAKKGAIAYRYEETPAGARVAIATADADARSAVHEFLRYQIREHKTGDSLDVK